METFTDASWDRAVLASPVPGVVGLWADRCVTSHQAKPARESAGQRHSGRLRFGLVNFDENPRLIERYAVQGLPTILVIKDGQPTDRCVGLMGRAALEDLLRRHVR